MIDKTNIVLPPRRRCENCCFWQEFEPNELGGREGMCVACAPVLTGVDEEGVPTFAQPITGVNATCGNHKHAQKIALSNGRVADGDYRWIYPASDNSDSDE